MQVLNIEVLASRPRSGCTRDQMMNSLSQWNILTEQRFGSPTLITAAHDTYGRLEAVPLCGVLRELRA
jgi:hypothetical protein